MGEELRFSLQGSSSKMFFPHQNAALTNGGFQAFCKIAAGQVRMTCHVTGVQPV